MNNTINRMKKRADTLADYIVERVEWLEEENCRYKELNHQNHHELRRHEMAFEKALDKITEIKKDKKDNAITITFKDKNDNGGMDTLYTYFAQDEPMYPLVEMLLEKYQNRVEFERLLRKALKSKFTPITPLTKGE